MDQASSKSIDRLLRLATAALEKASNAVSLEEKQNQTDLAEKLLKAAKEALRASRISN